MFEGWDLHNPNELWNNCEYDPSAPFEELEFILVEDMFAAFYIIDEIEYVIDIGWYPEGRKDGEYKVQIFINQGNSNPSLYEKRTKDYEVLEQYMKECLSIIDSLRKTVKRR